MTTPLPNTNLIGFPYNITGKFANATAVNLSAPLFSFPTTKGEQTVTVQGNSYTYPADQCSVAALNETLQVSTDFADARQASQTYSFGVEAGYRSPMFGGSVKTSFSASYDSSAYMTSVVQRTIVNTYELTLPYTLAQLQGMLAPQADTDINGVMDPNEVITNYGTHVLAKAIFGGLSEYSQSVSTLNAKTQIQAAAEVAANYKAYNGKATGSVSTDQIASSSQSTGRLQVSGGDPMVAGATYDQWAASVSAGNWVMIDFPKDDGALIPLASLASSPDRQKALTAAMNTALQAAGNPVPETYGLQWDPNREKLAYSQGPNPDITLRLDSSNQVVVGYGASVTKKKVSRAVLHVLDLSTNTTSDIWANTDHAIEKDVNVPVSVKDSYGNSLRGVAAVGVSACAESNNMTGISVWYQELNPADDGKTPTYLSGSTQKLTTGTSSTEVDYVSTDPGWIITEIGLGMDGSGGKVKVLHVKTAPLVRVLVADHPVGPKS